MNELLRIFDGIFCSYICEQVKKRRLAEEVPQVPSTMMSAARLGMAINKFLSCRQLGKIFGILDFDFFVGQNPKRDQIEK